MSNKLQRFYSVQNYGYIVNEANEVTPTTVPKHPKNYFRSLSYTLSKGERTIDKQEEQANVIDKLLKTKLTRVVSIPNNDSKDIIIQPISSHHTTIETGITHHAIKPGRQRWRWNLLFNLLVWLIVPFPLWIPFLSNQLALYVIPVIQTIFVFMWVIIAILAMKNAIILYINRTHNFINDYLTSSITIRHLVAISCYKEPVELILRSIQTIANQTEVKRITMVISFEERTPNVNEKCLQIENKFKDCGFERLIFTIHPFGIENEIPGKCSNANYGLRMAVEQMVTEQQEKFEPEHVLVTTCDADSQFHPQYLAALTSKYLHDKQPLTTIYQSPLFYNWNLDGLSFVTRVTGILRSTLMLGALIPFNINTMSIFSFSLRLAIDGNYVHPAYQMDDIICLIRWMGVTQRRLKVRMIPVPVLSGPTCGNTIEQEIMEWARQARRWTIGAAEVFHYYVIKAKRMPCLSALSWGMCFLIYYGILLCTSGLYGLTSILSMFLIIKNVPLSISYFMYALFCIQMLTFLVAFIIDIFIPKLLNVKECICFPRNLFHFLTTPFVLLGYSLVEFYALHEVVIRGKKVCKHGASNKNSLAS